MNKKAEVMEIFWHLAALKQVKQMTFNYWNILCFFLHSIDKSVYNVSLYVLPVSAWIPS